MPRWRYPIREWGWTDHAIDRCWHHGLDPRDLETAFEDPAAAEVHHNPRSTADETGLLIGRTFSGRIVTMVVTEPTASGLTEIRTVWPAGRGERSLYARKTRGGQL